MRKRRQFSPEFKAQVVLDVLTGVQSLAEACRKHSLGPNLLALWKTVFLEREHLVFDSDSARSVEQARITELEQVLGRMTLENEILKKQRSGKGLETREFLTEHGNWFRESTDVSWSRRSAGWLTDGLWTPISLCGNSMSLTATVRSVVG
jgi:transposase-like protein